MSRQHRGGSLAGTPLLGAALPLRWWRELALVLIGYWLYTAVRNAVPDQERVAMAQAERLYRFEQALSIDIELAVNQAIDRMSWLIVGMNYYYAVAHFIVTIAVLVWLYRRHPGTYVAARTVFLVTNASALVVFYLYPLAPPRLMPWHGYIDTVVTHGTWGSWASGDVTAATNQYAAMPSMHVAWSVFCGVLVVMLARRRWVRALGLAHPTVTLVVIVATGNHFVLDAVGGVLALGFGFAVLWVAVLIRDRVRPPRPPRPEPITPVPAAA
jgi:PAP2 superfamily